jgi:hypothetical protein
MIDDVVKFVIGLVALAVTSQVSLLAKQIVANQTHPQIGILRGAAAKIEKVELDWRFFSAICNLRGPLLNEQVGVECGLWAPRGEPLLGGPAAIGVRLHIVSSEDAASRWIDRQKREGTLAGGWTAADYNLADGARIATSADGTQFSIDVRKGRSLINVSGRTKSDVERFAKFLVAAISDEK